MNELENLDYCIEYLARQDGIEVPKADTPAEKRLMMRALMNVWQPQELDAAYQVAQDAELQRQLKEKGVVSLEEIEGEGQLLLWQGDIARLKIDAIVNAANSMGLGCWQPLHACIDNVIHSAAGLQLRTECAKVLAGGELATGAAMITRGYNLPASYVVHTVGPIIATGVPSAEQEEQLASCYRASMQVAGEKGCGSIAFCCISTGVFHFPNQRAAEIAVATVKECEERAAKGEMKVPEKVVFNVFKDIDYDIYAKLLGEG